MLRAPKLIFKDPLWFVVRQKRLWEAGAKSGRGWEGSTVDVGILMHYMGETVML